MIKNVAQKNKPTTTIVDNVAVGSAFVQVSTGTLYIQRGVALDPVRGGYKCLKLSEGPGARVEYVSANCEVRVVDINIEWELA